MIKILFLLVVASFLCEKVSAACYKTETKTGSYYKPFKGNWMIKVEPKKDGRFPAHDEPQRDENGNVVFEETALVKQEELEKEAVEVDCP